MRKCPLGGDGTQDCTGCEWCNKREEKKMQVTYFSYREGCRKTVKLNASRVKELEADWRAVMNKFPVFHDYVATVLAFNN